MYPGIRWDEVLQLLGRLWPAILNGIVTVITVGIDLYKYGKGLPAPKGGGDKIADDIATYRHKRSQYDEYSPLYSDPKFGKDVEDRLEQEVKDAIKPPTSYMYPS